MTIKEALDTVVHESNNEYAKTYARAALTLGNAHNQLVITRDNDKSVSVHHEPTNKIMVGEELRVQILYVLSNLQGWRGERAREVKKVLKGVN